MKTYAELVALGCLCGTDRIAECPVHAKPGDNRGIRAYFKAGMPQGFPIRDCYCSRCGSGGCLMYPSVELDRGEVPAGTAPGPTLICPRCSRPSHEARLVAETLDQGYDLNDARVFGAMAAAA